MSAKSDALWKRLGDAGVVQGDEPESTGSQAPWYVRVMLGVSGWIAALFLLGFVGVGLEFVIDSEVASISFGALGLIAAFAIFRLARSDFYEQFALAVSFAGQGLMFFGLAEWLGWRDSSLWWVAAVLQAVVALVMPNFIQRLVAGYLFAITLSTALALHGAPWVTSVLVTLVVVIIWLNEFGWRRLGVIVRPVAYGLTLALVQLEGQALIGKSIDLFYARHDTLRILMPAWVGELAIGLLLIAVVGRLLVRGGESWTGRRMLVALSVAAVIAGVSLEAPGIATGFMIVALGFANANRILVGLGIAALLCYVAGYYYTLETTLLVKSQILAATGVTLLVARGVVLKWVFPEEKERAHA